MNKKKGIAPLLIVLYGIICCLFLVFYEDIPKENRKYFQTSYTTFEYLVFTALLLFNIINKKIKPVILIVSALFIVFQVLYVMSGKVKRLDSIPIGIETILIVTYIIYFLFELSKNLEVSIYSHYCFWLSVGILIYLGGSFFFYIMIGSLSGPEIETFGNLTYVAEILKNLLFGLAFFVYAKYPLKKESEKKTESIPFLDMI